LRKTRADQRRIFNQKYVTTLFHALSLGMLPREDYRVRLNLRIRQY
jgi:hypothetical protein